VRTSKSTGKGRADADAAWRSAKARVIELETGAPPPWALPSDEHPAEHPPADDEQEQVEP